MIKFIAPAFVLSLMVVGAHAQSNPPGAAVPPNTPGYATGKSEQTGEMKKDMRTPGQVRTPVGDSNRTQEGTGIGNDRAAVNGERRAETRDERRPGKPRTTQGGTPK